jgi:membrane protein required for colicin V production
VLLAMVAFIFYSWLVPEANQPEWIKNARAKPFLQAGGDKLREMLPDVDVDKFVARIKAKKAAPAGEDAPPAEPEPDKAATPTPPPADAPPAEPGDKAQ